MNPNSAHQLWSRWTATVTPATPTAPPFAVVREQCARFYRAAFGSATELHITAAPAHWTIDCRTEGHPAHDATYVTYLTDQIRAFLLTGFGAKADVQVAVTIEAGDRQDGQPPDQLILGAPAVVLINRLLKEK